MGNFMFLEYIKNLNLASPLYSEILGNEELPGCVGQQRQGGGMQRKRRFPMNEMFSMVSGLVTMV